MATTARLEEPNCPKERQSSEPTWYIQVPYKAQAKSRATQHSVFEKWLVLVRWSSYWGLTWLQGAKNGTATVENSLPAP
jgi:hypothetical protein